MVAGQAQRGELNEALFGHRPGTFDSLNVFDSALGSHHQPGSIAPRSSAILERDWIAVGFELDESGALPPWWAAEPRITQKLCSMTASSAGCREPTHTSPATSSGDFPAAMEDPLTRA